MDIHSLTKLKKIVSFIVIIKFLANVKKFVFILVHEKYVNQRRDILRATKNVFKDKMGNIRATLLANQPDLKQNILSMDITLDMVLECLAELHITERETNMEEDENKPSIEIYPDSTSSSSDEHDDDGEDNGEDVESDKQDPSLGAISLPSTSQPEWSEMLKMLSVQAKDKLSNVVAGEIKKTRGRPKGSKVS